MFRIGEFRFERQPHTPKFVLGGIEGEAILIGKEADTITQEDLWESQDMMDYYDIFLELEGILVRLRSLKEERLEKRKTEVRDGMTVQEE